MIFDAQFDRKLDKKIFATFFLNKFSKITDNGKDQSRVKNPNKKKVSVLKSSRKIMLVPLRKRKQTKRNVSVSN